MESSSRSGSRQIQPASSGGFAGAIRAVAGFRPHRRPKTSAAILLWLLGLLLVFVVQAPPPSEAQLQAFRAKLQEAQSVDGSLGQAERQLIDLEVDLDHVKGWFWRFRPAQRAEVEKRMPAVRAARQRVDELLRQRADKVKEAKSQLGLWSEAGLEESRELFWESFSSGKVFAQRQSFWDSLFIILTNREHDWLALALKLLLQTLMNFTTGMVVAVFVFAGRLPWLLASFGCSLWSALPFFVLAVVSAVSVVVSYLGLLYGASAGVAYTVVSAVSAQRRAALEPGRQRPPAPIQYGAGRQLHLE